MRGRDRRLERVSLRPGGTPRVSYEASGVGRDMPPARWTHDSSPCFIDEVPKMGVGKLGRKALRAWSPASAALADQPPRTRPACCP